MNVTGTIRIDGGGIPLRHRDRLGAPSGCIVYSDIAPRYRTGMETTEHSLVTGIIHVVRTVIRPGVWLSLIKVNYYSSVASF